MPFNKERVEVFYESIKARQVSEEQAEAARATRLDELKTKFAPLVTTLNDPLGWVDPELAKDIPQDEACLVKRRTKVTYCHHSGDFFGRSEVVKTYQAVKILPHENRQEAIDLLDLGKDQLSGIGLVIKDFWSDGKQDFPRSHNYIDTTYSVLLTPGETIARISGTIQGAVQGVLALTRNPS